MRDYTLMKMPVEEIGRALAYDSNEAQAAVINSLGNELNILCKQNAADMQICYITDSLDRHGREFVRRLAEFVNLREEADKP